MTMFETKSTTIYQPLGNTKFWSGHDDEDDDDDDDDDNDTCRTACINWIFVVI